ncbi:membrane or secreted protein [Pontibacter roseus]|uniref:membrane or secreted protein n=1 Tax=Pontibacter roseus TaxID=336989 RepID=UPI001B7FA091|nr:membrane or secreted protein [Pontibacter roseus]
MKRLKLAGMGLLLLMGFTAPAPIQQPQQTTTDAKKVQTNQLEGAWRMQDPSGNSIIMLVQDGFFTVAVYDQPNKKFLGTTGGTFIAQNGKLTITPEFDTMDSTKVGKPTTSNYKLEKGKWHISNATQTETWEKVQEQGTSPLAGTWRITGRERDGQMNTMRPGPRKTLKVLSGTRFQWIAFNSETGEFSGTGGGSYTAKDGKYTEHIEFFSRDSSRVGMQLSFNFEVKDGKWHHTGQSSTGNKVNEIWERISAK